jgi:hypothetical protein
MKCGLHCSRTLTPMGFWMPRMNSTCDASSWRVRSPHHRKCALQSYLHTAAQQAAPDEYQAYTTACDQITMQTLHASTAAR